MELAAILTEYGRRYGLEHLTLDDAGRCALSLDREAVLLIDHRPASRAVFLRVPFALPPLAGPEERAVLYRRLLRANLLGEETGGAVFSVDLDEEHLELHRRVPLDTRIETRDFADRVDALYGTARHFAAELGLAFDTGE